MTFIRPQFVPNEINLKTEENFTSVFLYRNNVSVFRINKNNNYTTMNNYHLRDAIQSVLNELKTCQYLSINRSRDSFGRYEYEYIIYELSAKERTKSRDSPNTGFPYTDLPLPENPHQINTKEQIEY